MISTGLYNKSANARTVLRHCASSVFHCVFTVAATVLFLSLFIIIFFSFIQPFVYSIGTVAIVPKVFFFFFFF